MILDINHEAAYSFFKNSGGALLRGKNGFLNRAFPTPEPDPGNAGEGSETKSKF
ncbi:hypothetical protein AGMMS50276_05410 [Synergistales bacterium]|nr:hypothetical protein AGMMS50276_05410 [Synergistales bacterium]